MATGHEKVEKNVGLMIILITVVVSIGGLVQIVPLFFMKSMTEPVDGLKPYPALQLAGRDIYIRESCMVCHSQMIRPFRAETERYGHYSVAGEFVYDRPFQWGSKRTGPDLHRVGGRYSDDWHYTHLINPRDVVPESVMPGYPSLEDNVVDGEEVQHKMRVLKDWLGHPYTEEDIDNAPQAVEGKTEMQALIAYLQNLGTALKKVR
ncbi:MAG TPA: cytochrome-c oxidase, cbb3-type subunit II [Thioploca sp.]|nr:MAG: cytochrome-c oxidase, cbb3-type subunit II [Beggiatoa sp. 4572_84]RKZ52289.1 MAG: cytochrome-c oxidase, cbb3-type subunit II [Gammaproteobacteria bacterium]HDN27846.1 cytochrome-c oxidase, cbb3-type subunit II [Thioploca sp.]